MRQDKSFRTVFCLVFFILMAFCLTLFIKLQNKSDDIRKNNLINNLNQLLPIIREQSRPRNLIKSYVTKELAEISQINSQTAATLKSSFTQTFGKNFSLLVLDREKQTSLSYGLSRKMEKDFKAFITDIYFDQLDSRHVPASDTLLFLDEIFDNTISVEFLPNFINITPCRMNGVNGTIVIATLIKPHTVKYIRKRKAMTRPAAELANSYLGSTMAFIPEASYAQTDFVRDFLAINNDLGISFVTVGQATEVAKTLENRFSKNLANTFKEQVRSNHQKVIFNNDQAVGFTRVQETESSQDIIVAFALTSSTTFFLQEHLPVSLLFLANIAFFLFFHRYLTNAQAKWNSRLQGKFLALAVSACLFPFAGLIYQNNLQLELRNNADERQILTDLENKLQVIENNFLNLKNNLAILLQKFNQKIDPEKPIDVERMENETEALRKNHVIQLYLANSDGSIDSIDTKEAWTSEDTKTGTKFVKALLQFIVENLKLNFASSPSSKSFNKEGILIESVAEALGVEALYQLAINQRQFLPFKLSQGSAWTYVDLQRNRQGGPTRLIMHVAQRDYIIKKFIDLIQSQEDQLNPTLFFMSRSMLQIEDLAPNSLETSAKLISILQTANAYRGSTRLKIEDDKTKTFIVARQLKEMNWSCLAIQKRRKDEFSMLATVSIMSFSILVYLLLLLAFLSTWLGNFFLKPVMKLEKSASAIAEGNYISERVCKTDDELGFLAGNFASMARELEEKEFLDRFLSDIARDAISGQKTTRATKIEATVLFSDIRSFTTLSETFPPEQIGQMLNDYMTFMEEIIEKHGGSIEKFIGDAIMAVFLPRMGMPHPAWRATQAAQEMIPALEKFNLQRKQENLFTVSNGFGIAHGELLMGTMGNLSGRRDFTVTGKTVNLAAEMEKLSKDTRKLPIVICPATMAVAKSQGLACMKLSAHNLEVAAYELI